MPHHPMAASISCVACPHLALRRNLPIFSHRSLSLASFSSPKLPPLLAFKASGTEGPAEPALLRRPAVAAPPTSDEGSAGESLDGGRREEEKEDEWVDWEDQILEDTVPLVGFVRMVLHSGKYASGDRLSPEHEKMVLERILPFHPECEKKIGCGIDYITIGLHPQYENSRCLFIVRKDGELVDFSYWKCIKGLIRKNYPLYADTFILKHFRRRRHAE